MPAPARVDAQNLRDECWDNPARGTIRFRTLISAPATDSDSLVCGVAMMAPGDTFALHSHPRPRSISGWRARARC